MASTEEKKTKELLQDQAAQRNPFEMAQQKAAQPIRETASSFDPFKDPFEPQGINVEQTPDITDRPKLMGLLQQPTNEERETFSKSGVPKMFQSAGLGDLTKDLAFNQLGKIQLITRLKDRFGPEFMSHDFAIQALAAFEKELNKNKDEEDKEAVRMNRQGQRTLNALLKGI